MILEKNWVRIGYCQKLLGRVGYRVPVRHCSQYNGTLSISQVQSTSYVPDTCTLGMAEVNSMSLSGVPGFHEDRKCDQCNVICNGEADLEFHMKTKHV